MKSLINVFSFGIAILANYELLISNGVWSIIKCCNYDYSFALLLVRADTKLTLMFLISFIFLIFLIALLMISHMFMRLLLAELSIVTLVQIGGFSQEFL